MVSRFYVCFFTTILNSPLNLLTTILHLFQDPCSRILVPGSSFHDSCFRILVQDSCSGSSFHDICSRILVQDARSWILVVPYLILYSNTEFHILYFTLILSSKNSSLIYMFSIAGHAHTAEPNWLNFLYLSF